MHIELAPACKHLNYAQHGYAGKKPISYYSSPPCCSTVVAVVLYCMLLSGSISTHRCTKRRSRGTKMHQVLVADGWHLAWSSLGVGSGRLLVVLQRGEVVYWSERNDRRDQKPENRGLDFNLCGIPQQSLADYWCPRNIPGNSKFQIVISIVASGVI